ncbi:MAG: type IV pili twitching motility protein PilT, partial [Oscillospiraceae bacterium]
MLIKDILQIAVETEASDVFIVSGCPVTMKIGSQISPIDTAILKPNDTHVLITEIYTLQDNRNIKPLESLGDDDFSFSISGLGRFRCNAYKQRGSLACVIRIVAIDLPDFQMLNIPQTVMELSTQKKGLVLITGPAG